MRCCGMAKEGSRAPSPGGVRAVTSQTELLVVTKLPGQGRSRGMAGSELFGGAGHEFDGQVLGKESAVCWGALRVVAGLGAHESNTSGLGEVWGGAELQKKSPKKHESSQSTRDMENMDRLGLVQWH